MKNKRGLLLFIALMLLISTLLIGCNTVPKEYTDGVNLDRDYPDKDLPIMDDAIIYYCEEDTPEITIKYGVPHDLDDVADFYKDHFEDNEIVLDDETDKSTRYSAKGSYKDFKFEIRVTPPSNEHEEKQFETIIKIEIVLLDESIEASNDYQNLIETELLGFWRQESFDDGSGKLATTDEGIAYEFLADGSLNLYASFVYVATGGWSIIDQSTVFLTAIDGSQEEVTVSFERRSSYEYLLWQDSTGLLTFYRDVPDEFSSDTELQSADIALAAAIADITWYYVQYSDSDSQIYNQSSGSLIYHSDGTYEDALDGTTDYGTWYVSNGGLYCQSDDSSIGNTSWGIEVKTENGINYLYYYGSDEPEYWLYSSQPLSFGAFSFTDITWYVLSYIDKDGTETIITDSDTYVFYDDGSFLNAYGEKEALIGNWEIEDDILYAHFDDTSVGTIFWGIEMEVGDSINHIKLYDMREENAGAYWIYTDRLIIDGRILFTSDADLIDLIANVVWNELHYLYADGSTEPMTQNALFFTSAGILEDTFDGVLEYADWSIEDGCLSLIYHENNTELYFPLNIEFDIESSAFYLYFMDIEEGYEGCSWVFTTYEP